jgi:SAM-dependent methyltransferase
MHKSSLQEMQLFFDKHLKQLTDIKILDVGSAKVDNDGLQTYKDLLKDFNNIKYIGIDLQAGVNVDQVIDNPYCWPFKYNSFDVVISGQCLEHVENIFKWFHEIYRVLKANGMCCIIAPWIWPEHRYPIDCWRILPDGMTTLFKAANLKIINIYKNSTGDCIGIGKK